MDKEQILQLESIPLGSVVLIDGEEYVVVFTEQLEDSERTYLGLEQDKKEVRTFILSEVEEIIFWVCKRSAKGAIYITKLILSTKFSFDMAFCLFKKGGTNIEKA